MGPCPTQQEWTHKVRTLTDPDHADVDPALPTRQNGFMPEMLKRRHWANNACLGTEFPPWGVWILSLDWGELSQSFYILNESYENHSGDSI